jgi:hypothetical protein
MVKLNRKIFSCCLQKADPEAEEPKPLNVFVPSCGWGVLSEIDAKGRGYINFASSGGQLVRNWAHFFDMVTQIDMES